MKYIVILTALMFNFSSFNDCCCEKEEKIGNPFNIMITLSESNGVGVSGTTALPIPPNTTVFGVEAGERNMSPYSYNNNAYYSRNENSADYANSIARDYVLRGETTPLVIINVSVGGTGMSFNSSASIPYWNPDGLSAPNTPLPVGTSAVEVLRETITIVKQEIIDMGYVPNLIGTFVDFGGNDLLPLASRVEFFDNIERIISENIDVSFEEKSALYLRINSNTPSVDFQNIFGDLVTMINEYQQTAIREVAIIDLTDSYSSQIDDNFGFVDNVHPNEVQYADLANQLLELVLQ